MMHLMIWQNLSSIVKFRALTAKLLYSYCLKPVTVHPCGYLGAVFCRLSCCPGGGYQKNLGDHAWRCIELSVCMVSCAGEEGCSHQF